MGSGLVASTFDRVFIRVSLRGKMKRESVKQGTCCEMSLAVPFDTLS